MVTLLAFVVLLGGGAHAADRLGKSSVGTKQLKRNAVTSAKVKNASLTGKDLASGVLGPASRGFQASGSVNFDSFSSSPFGSTVVSLAVPPGVSLRSMASSSTIRLRKRAVGATTPPKAQRGLAIGGSAVQLERVGRFMTNLDNMPSFAETWLNATSLQRGGEGQISTYRFEIIAILALPEQGDDTA